MFSFLKAISTARSMYIIKRVADLSYSAGMVNLGFMYAEGRGVERNDITAVALYQKAAAAGNRSASASTSKAFGVPFPRFTLSGSCATSSTNG